MDRDADRPVTEAVPEVPPRHPILLVDIRLVLAQGVVVLQLRPGVIGERQYLSVLRSLGYFIPLVWCPSG
jgi:hypothetical protein